MPGKKSYAVGIIHRAHVYDPREGVYNCVNVLHDKRDCYSAGLAFSAYCEPCRRHSLRHNPTIVINDVRYVMDYGVGYTKPLSTMFCMEPVREPVYVWRCWDALDYTAPHHVANHLWELLNIAEEIATAEAAVGWDPNP